MSDKIKVVIFDTETTGLLKPAAVPLEKQPKIIELGIVVVEDGIKVSEHNWLIDPEEQITEEITKITGIKNEDLIGKPKFRELLGEIEEVFGGSMFGIAHNAPFDVGMLNNELLRCARTGFPWPKEVLCTVQEYRHEFGGKYCKLIQLYEKKMGKPLAQTHRALDDAIALYELLSVDNFFARLEL